MSGGRRSRGGVVRRNVLVPVFFVVLALVNVKEKVRRGTAGTQAVAIAVAVGHSHRIRRRRRQEHHHRVVPTGLFPVLVVLAEPPPDPVTAAAVPSWASCLHAVTSARVLYLRDNPEGRSGRLGQVSLKAADGGAGLQALGHCFNGEILLRLITARRGKRQQLLPTARSIQEPFFYPSLHVVDLSHKVNDQGVSNMHFSFCPTNKNSSLTHMLASSHPRET